MMRASEAVREAKELLGVKVDGVVGPVTRAAYNRASRFVKDRISEIFSRNPILSLNVFTSGGLSHGDFPDMVTTTGTVMSREFVIALIRKIAREENFDEDFAVKVAQLESEFNPNAGRGIRGKAQGVFQLFPAAAIDAWGRQNPAMHFDRNGELLEPAWNIRTGIRYLKWCATFLRSYGLPVNQSNIYACYNLGPGNALKLLTQRIDAAVQNAVRVQARKLAVGGPSMYIRNVEGYFA